MIEYTDNPQFPTKKYKKWEGTSVISLDARPKNISIVFLDTSIKEMENRKVLVSLILVKYINYLGRNLKLCKDYILNVTDCTKILNRRIYYVPGIKGLVL